MRIRTTIFAALTVLAAVSGPALAQQERVNIYQYAIDHPVEDAKLNTHPSLGASVPGSIQLATVGEENVYGYFYFEGRPVIVDLTTRAVVRVD